MSLTNVEDIYPLSPIQEAWLPQDPAGASSGGQCAQLTAVLTGRLDQSAFEWAWQQVLSRHAILRTSFVWERIDKPVQLVMRQLPVTLVGRDWRSLAVEQQHEQFIQLLQTELRMGVNPAKAPLMRIVLCRMGDEVHHLICTYHRLILDERGLFLMLEEVLAFYESFGNGRNPQLAPSCPYWAYVKWANEKDSVEREKSRQQPLKSFRERTALAERYLHDNPAGQTDGYGEESWELPASTVTAGCEFAARCRIRFETLIQGAWVLLLNRENDEDEICFGLVVADCPAELNRDGRMLGPLIKTLPVCVQVPYNTSAGGWLKQFDRYLAELRQDQFLHLKETREWSSAASPQQLFETVFLDGEALVHERAQLSGASLRIQNVRAVSAEQTGLLVKLRPGPAGALQLSYDRRRYAPETIRRMLGHFERLLAGIIDDPDCLILDLPFLTASEAAQVLREWNQTETAYPRESCIHELFEQQAHDRPEAIAAVYENEEITYAELNCRANQLAHHLQLLGVQPESRVALCVERSLGMLVGILGTLKAGAAYAPLDPAHPLERLAFMLEDLQAPVVLTEQRLLDRLPAHWAQVVCLDTDWVTIASQSRENTCSGASAENLAYVMYTSGSTGTPKGVSVSHRAVVRLVKETNFAELSCREVWLQFAPLSFDASTLEIWGSMLNGGRLAVMPALWSSLDSLGQALKKHEVTTLWLTAGLFHLMVDERLVDLQSVRQLLAGGDSLSVPHLRKAFHALPNCRLINGYGPTEGTTFTCCYPVVDIAEVRGTVPIGKPVSNTQVFILDRYLRAVPPGATGELYIAGDGLARDYHNRAMLTAERFIPNPYSDAPGGRLYRTGDLVRYLPDGNIDFIGRRDLQVKVRGFRIELGEIEAALNGHPAVQDVVVIARADMPGEKQLVAYLVTSKETSVSVQELRDFLRQKLPDHMMPAAFVMIEALPLTLNGKVNRQALPAPGGHRMGLAENLVAARTPCEEVLAAIWSQALAVDQIGIDDNFFSLGGDSIRAVQVLARAQERELVFSLQDLFQYQTIRELAQIINTADQESEGSEAHQPFSLISEADLLNLPHDIEDAYPLTMLQAGMIFHSELDPETAVYHDIFSHHLRAPYNPDALRMAFASLLKRHGALRTGFVLHGFSEPLQLVHRTVPVMLPVTDLRDLDPAAQDAFLRNMVETEKVRVFDWERAPLLNLQIHRRSNESFQFTISFHHAILDGWSMASMLVELFQTYVSLLHQNGSQPEVLPPLAGSYRDYVAMELRALRSAECQNYWTEKLSGSSIATLPHWPQSGLTRDSQIHRIDVPIPAEVSAGLKTLARSASVPIKSVLLAAHLKVMSLIAGQTDIITGVVSNGRPEQNDGDRILGLFLNTIPFRVALRPGSWADLVQQTFQTEWEALPYRWYPLAQLQRQQGGQALFETAFNYTHFHVTRGLQDRSDVEILESISFERTNLPLVANFSFQPNSSGIHLLLVFDPERFGAEQADAVVNYYRKVLALMSSAPEARHEAAALLSESELRQLLGEWNDTAANFPNDLCLHQLFEQQVERTPSAEALIFEETRVTYRELNERANQLAQYLQQLGVGPEQLVAVFLDRSVEMVVAVLAVLKAGGAYVPMDPAYPPLRLALMLDDARVPVIITQRSLMTILPASNAEVVCLDTDWETISKGSKNNPPVGVGAANLAYVLYTSGSTGKPKGVQIPHRAVVNFLFSMRAETALTEKDVMLAVTSLSFDIAALELFLPLMVGARVELVSREIAIDGERLTQRLASSGATAMQATPTSWRLIADSGWEQPGGLKAFCGGEALSRELANRLIERGATLWNLYGPTETTIWSTSCRVESVNGIVPIGRPISNTQVYILNEHLQCLPVGVAGELYIGGEGLARGYLSLAESTAEKFIPNPCSAQPGARLYRTGDLARYLPDGNLQFMGRTDQQVKLRGFRIELEEIESHLIAHPALREAVVLVRQEAFDDARLVAYLVNDEAQPAPTSEELRAYLQKFLPDYMVPSTFVILPQLPLTPNGKIDRRALPVPFVDISLSDGAPAAPRTEIERLLLSIWAAVLKVDGFGVNDNFFALGGHSLSATQVVTRMREALQLDVPLRRMFTHPTVAKLGSWVETALRDQTAPPPPLVAVARTKPLPLSFAQQRLWFIDQLTPGSVVYNMPLAMRLRGSLQVDVLERALSEIVRRHEVLRTSFEMAGDGPVQVIAPAEPVPLRLEDLRELDPGQRDEAARERMRSEAHEPFDLSRPPLLRARLLRLDDEDYLALLTMHHVSSDAWSLGVLVREVALLYGAFARGEDSPLPALGLQYADYAAWQRGWLQGDELAQHLSYWRDELGGAPEILELPADRPRPPVQSHRGAHHRFALNAGLSDRVRQLGRAAGVTTFMVLLAAWQALLHRLSGEEDISVGTAVSGRTHVEVEPLIGFFVNTLVLRVQLGGDPSFAELVERVRAVCVGAYGHQEVPFEKLVEELAPERSMAHTPLFQVMMVMQPEAEAMEQPEGLAVSGVGAELESAKYDLTLWLREGAGKLSGGLEYNTDIFDAARAQRMVEQWERVLAAAVEDPHRRLSELPLLSDHERTRMVTEWNETAAEYEAGKALPQLFEEQAQRSPEAIALVCQHEQISYRELNRRANQLAHHLRKLGVGPERLVGVCMERSVEMVVALLGILKAGGAYVPLDPEYPSDRLSFMLADAQTSVLLTQERLVAKLAPRTSQTLCLDTNWPWIALESDADLETSVGDGNLAYVIYTSGSTGQPKGVMIHHRGLTNYLSWAANAYSVSEGCGAQVHSSASFDLTVTSLFAPLLVGKSLFLLPDGIGALAASLVERDYSFLKITPAHLIALAELMPAYQFAGRVRALIVGGEPLHLESLTDWRQHAPATRLINEYGPTETVVGCCVYEVAADDAAAGPVLIGRPIANTQIYLLDQHLGPVPIGVPGELYIGGDGVGRGYWRRPDFTAERFVPDPFSAQEGARLYRSGDFARFKSDGQIEFLGRRDHQVKLRGFRIELGEVESVLREHDSVREAAVIVQGSGTETRLAAFVVSRGPTLTAGELRLYLKAKLPDYMVPSVLVWLDELPLTPNGKLDRRALEAAQPGLRLEEVFVAPRDVLEFQLARIWEEVLDVRPIGMKDNFFELGGHSLLAVRLMTQIASATGRTLPLSGLIEGATIESLAKLIRQQGEPLTPSPLVAIRREGDGPALFCVHPAGGNVLCYAALAQHLGPGRPFYGLQARGLEDGEEPFTSVEAAAAHYVEAIRTIQPEGPYLIGGWSTGGLIAFEMVRLLQEQRQQIALLALFDSRLTYEKQVAEDDATLLINSALHMGLPPEHVSALREGIQNLKADEQLNFATDHIRRLNLLPPGIEAAQTRALIRVFKANLQAARSYVPRAGNARVTLFQASDPHFGSPANLAADWRSVARDGVEVREIPGDHFAIMRDPHVKVLAEQLNECLLSALDGAHA